MGNNRAEYAACATSPPYLIDNYIWIEDATAREWVRFRLWQRQYEVLTTLQVERMTIILKARQLGLTWLALAYALWMMLFRPGSRDPAVFDARRRSDRTTDTPERDARAAAALDAARGTGRQRPRAGLCQRQPGAGVPDHQKERPVIHGDPGDRRRGRLYPVVCPPDDSRQADGGRGRRLDPALDIQQRGTGKRVQADLARGIERPEQLRADLSTLVKPPGSGRGLVRAPGGRLHTGRSMARVPRDARAGAGATRERGTVQRGRPTEMLPGCGAAARSDRQPGAPWADGVPCAPAGRPVPDFLRHVRGRSDQRLQPRARVGYGHLAGGRSHNRPVRAVRYWRATWHGWPIGTTRQ